tara:strand:+ start:409 stop:915 length:507 start_codon:yes stop_codon:yes gene_type:complete
MAGFHTKTFLKHDDYMTPKSAWENIAEYIPKDKVIWEAFMGDGKSGEYLQEMGHDVIHNDNDFFESDEGDVIVSNPPFSKCKDIIPRLLELDKPFILILPSSKINTQYFRENFKSTDTSLQIIIPRRRIQFVKNGTELQNKCNFDCFYYCYKIGLPRDIVWLELTPLK